MKVYIRTYKKQFSDDWIFAAYLGFKKREDPKKKSVYIYEDIDKVPFDKDIVLVTGVDESIYYLEKYGINVPSPLNVPNELNSYEFTNRSINVITMGEFMEDETIPIFVKPHSKYKEFDSGVLPRLSTKKILLYDVPHDRLVMTSSLIDFKSEYRCFVYNGKLEGIKHYQGDFKIFPDVNSINKMIEKFNSPFVAYTLDVGICEDIWNNSPSGQLNTVLVEAQDMWSIGNYGFNSDKYSAMLRDRWFQIIR